MHNLVLQYFGLHSTIWAIFEPVSQKKKKKLGLRSWAHFSMRCIIKIYMTKKENVCPLIFFFICVHFLFVSLVFAYSSKFTVFFSEDFLSRQAVGIFSPWWLSRRWRTLLLVVFLTVKVQVCGFSCHKEDTVVNVSQHRAVVLCVGRLNGLFLHLQEKYTYRLTTGTRQTWR